MIKSALPETLEESVPVEVFKAEVAAWGRRLGVTYRELHVRPLKRKWASCSSRGRLTFDTDLPKQPAAFRAETIVHELLHLKVPNHGRVFKALLRTYLAVIHGPDSRLGNGAVLTPSCNLPSCGADRGRSKRPIQVSHGKHARGPR